MKYIKIFDTTLRDGEQSPGASLNAEEKLEIAKQLARLKVDIIEAGFPIASEGDFLAVKQIAQNVKGVTICGLARARKEDIDRAWEALKHSQKPRLHTFIATSPIHMKYKLKKPPQEVLKTAVEMVRYAKSLCPDVEFSAEDAGRSEAKFLYKIFEAVINAGATTINIPDTVGYTIPSEFGKLVRGIVENVSNISKVDVSVHCHNDLGLATANSLEAVRNGATQVECTINGIGERAGNASLEEIVMSIKTRKDFFDLAFKVKTEEIHKTSRLVSHLTGMSIQPNKAIVGANAFAHESGIHQDGILKMKTTYEIMDAASIGLSESKLIMGKHSGRHAFSQKLIEIGYHLNAEELNRAFQRFKEIADKKKEVTDRDIESIITDELAPVPETYSLEYVQAIAGNTTKPAATVQLIYKEKVLEASSTGSGPVDATYKTVDKIIGRKINLVDYNIQAVSGGTDALGEVVVRIKQENKIFSGRGTSTDIIVASIKAYLNAINKMIHELD